MIRFWLIALTMLAAAGPARAADRLNVVASFSILGDFVRNVGGDRVGVTTLVGPDSDAHVYAPTPADAKKVADAKLVFVNGLGFEGWMPRLVKSAGGKASIVTATTGIAPLKLGSEADPHAWQSVANAKIYVANIRDALAAAVPADAEAFKSKAQAYLTELDALEREVREAIAKIPEGRRKVISTHNAFGHHPGQGRQNTGRVSGKYHRSPPDGPDSGRDRRPGRRNALFGQLNGRKGRFSHLHCHGQAQYKGLDQRAEPIGQGPPCLLARSPLRSCYV